VHPLPPNLLRLSDSAFFGFGVLTFLITLAVQYGLFHRLLRGPLLTHDAALMRAAVGRWLKVVLVWQVVVLLVSAGYVASLSSAHAAGYAWVAPAIGAVFGTAIPLQLAVVAILKASRGS